MTDPDVASTSHRSDVVLVTAAWFVLALVAAALPLRNWDYWFHITVGRLLDVHHAIPATNVFGYSAPPTTSVFLHTWIGDYWLYSLHEFGGLVATVLARNLCALTALALLAWCTYRLGGRHAVATSVLTLAGGLAFFAISGFAGPQMFVWPLFGLLAAMFVASRSWQRMWLVPVVTVAATAFWANTAPNFWAPVALAAVFAGVAQFTGDPRRRNWYIAAALLAPIAMLATPLGTRIFLALLNGTGSEAWLLLAAPLALSPLVGAAPRFERRIPRPPQIAAVLGMACVALAVQPWSDAHSSIPAAVFGDAVRQTDPLRGLGPSNTPVEAVELLKSWGSQPHVYAAPHLSGYLLYELQNPQTPSAIVWSVPDRAASEELAKTERAMQTDREILRGVFHQLDVKAVIVTPELGKVGQLIASAPDWVAVGTWPSGTLYIRERAH